MRRIQRALCVITLLFSTRSTNLWAQQAATTSEVPRLVRFSGTIKDVSGKPLTGVAGVTFTLYKDQEGGAALWIETQNVQLDSSGRYSILLGASKAEGLPVELFASGEARWLDVQAAGQAEQARVLLLSVPYALKAADAETVGGLPASAFMRAPQSDGAFSSSPTQAATPYANLPPTVHGSGTLNYLPIWTGTSTIGNSTLFEKSGSLGIGTNAPATTLDVNGPATIRGNATITGALSASSSLTAKSAGFTGNSSSQILSVTQSGTGTGLSATTAATAATVSAISGTATSTSGQAKGVNGTSLSDSGIGVYGYSGTFGGTGTSTGVFGISTSSAGTGVAGSGWIGIAGTGNAVGGRFQAAQNPGLILEGLNASGAGVFAVDGSGNLSTGGFLAAHAALVAGNALETYLGDPGCGSGTAAIAFGNAGFLPCSNYALRGDSGGNLYINSSSTGWMFFDHNNSGLMSLDPSGNLGVHGGANIGGPVGVGTSSPNAQLDVRGSAGSSGYGIATDSNAWQARSAGGFIKALAYINPGANGGIAVTRCYNSQMTGAAVTTPPCGIAINHIDQGFNIIDFGFEVDDRFFLAMSYALDGVAGGRPANLSCGGNGNQVCIATFRTSDLSPEDTPFNVVVF